MLEYTLDAGDLELPGGTYPIVPLKPIVLVAFEVSWLPGSTINFARSKSASTALMSLLRRMLLGLTSQWIIGGTELVWR